MRCPTPGAIESDNFEKIVNQCGGRAHWVHGAHALTSYHYDADNGCRVIIPTHSYHFALSISAAHLTAPSIRGLVLHQLSECLHFRVHAARAFLVNHLHEATHVVHSGARACACVLKCMNVYMLISSASMSRIQVRLRASKEHCAAQ